MTFTLTGLSADPFRSLYGRPDAELEAQGVRRLAAGDSAPCRVTLDDVPAGEPVLLLNFEHLPGPSSYRGSGPIFVREGALETEATDRIPDSFRARLYSARAYDEEGWMLDAEVAEGAALEALVDRLFANPAAAFLHLHHARRGCYACQVHRS